MHQVRSGEEFTKLFDRQISGLYAVKAAELKSDNRRDNSRRDRSVESLDGGDEWKATRYGCLCTRPEFVWNLSTTRNATMFL